MNDSKYKEMSADLEAWDILAIKALETGSLEIRKESYRILGLICEKHGVTIEQFRQYLFSGNSILSVGNS